MSVRIFTGSAFAQNRPFVNPNGFQVAAGNGVSNVCSPETPDTIVQLQGANPQAPLYCMGPWDAGYLCLEVLSAQQATVWNFQPNQARVQIAEGPFAGNQTFASKGHWSTIGGAMGVCVDGKAHTRALAGSGWVQAGRYAIYQKQDFSALVVEDLESPAFWTIPPPAGPYCDNDYTVFDLGGYAVATFTAGGWSWLWDSRTGVSTAVNLPALRTAGIGESTAQVVQVNGVLWVGTWDASMRVYFRSLGSPLCLNANAPGNFMSLQCDGVNLVMAANDGNYRLWTVLASLDTPLELPYTPSTPVEPALPVEVDPLPYPIFFGIDNLFFAGYGTEFPPPPLPCPYDFGMASSPDGINLQGQNSLVAAGLGVMTAGTIVSVPPALRRWVRIGGEGASLDVINQRLIGARPLSVAVNTPCCIELDTTTPQAFGIPASFDRRIDWLTWLMFLLGSGEARESAYQRFLGDIRWADGLGVQFIQITGQAFDPSAGTNGRIAPLPANILANLQSLWPRLVHDAPKTVKLAFCLFGFGRQGGTKDFPDVQAWHAETRRAIPAGTPTLIRPSDLVEIEMTPDQQTKREMISTELTKRAVTGGGYGGFGSQGAWLTQQTQRVIPQIANGRPTSDDQVNQALLMLLDNSQPQNYPAISAAVWGS